MIENNIEFSEHVKQRIKERSIEEEWIKETIQSPDKIVEKSEKEIHYFRKIIDFAGRCLKVVFNPLKNLVVTAYFDRNMTKKNCQ